MRDDEKASILLFISLLLLCLFFYLYGILGQPNDKSGSIELSQAQSEQKEVNSADESGFLIVSDSLIGIQSHKMDGQVLGVNNDPREKYFRKIEGYSWNHNIAKAVMREESHYDPGVYNPEWHDGCQGSYGLFQIACVHGYSEEEMYHWERNIEIAYKIWQQEGWLPWGVCHDGKVRCW